MMGGGDEEALPVVASEGEELAETATSVLRREGSQRDMTKERSRRRSMGAVGAVGAAILHAEEKIHEVAAVKLHETVERIKHAEDEFLLEHKREVIWSTKFCLFVACLVGLCGVCAEILHRVEEPVELRKIDEAKREKRFIQDIYLHRLFGFYVVPNSSTAFASAVLPSLGGAWAGFEQMRCREPARGPRGDGVAWCEACARELEGRYGTRYVLQDQRRAVREQTVVLKDGSPTFADCDSDSSSDCQLTCLLRLPTREEVGRCLGRRQDDHAVAPFLYNDTCLVEASAARCPNCWNLASVHDDVRASGGGLSWNPGLTDAEDPRGDRWASRAVLYSAVRALAEVPLPARNWDYGGAVFFTATLYATVGYGNFVTETRAGKVVVIAFIIPAIILFGLAISGLARQFLQSIQRFLDNQRKDMLLRRALHNGGKVLSARQRGAAARKWHHIVRSMDLDRDGQLSLEELMIAARQRPEHKAVPKAEVRKIFHMFDADKSGDLDYHEAILMLMVLDERYRASVVEEDSEADIAVTLSLTVTFIFTMAAVYTAVEADWDYVTALYFVLVSLTTCGLGDIVPKTDTAGQRVLFYAFLCVGLGLVGSILGSFQSVFVSRKNLEDIDAVDDNAGLFNHLCGGDEVPANNNKDGGGGCRKDHFDPDQGRGRFSLGDLSSRTLSPSRIVAHLGSSFKATMHFRSLLHLSSRDAVATKDTAAGGGGRVHADDFSAADRRPLPGSPSNTRTVENHGPTVPFKGTKKYGPASSSSSSETQSRAENQTITIAANNNNNNNNNNPEPIFNAPKDIILASPAVGGAPPSPPPPAVAPAAKTVANGAKRALAYTVEDADDTPASSEGHDDNLLHPYEEAYGNDDSEDSEDDNANTDDAELVDLDDTSSSNNNQAPIPRFTTALPASKDDDRRR